MFIIDEEQIERLLSQAYITHGAIEQTHGHGEEFTLIDDIANDIARFEAWYREAITRDR